MNTSFMIGCSADDDGSYSVGQVIYNNPDNNAKTFTVCKWDESLRLKHLLVYSKKYNDTYSIGLDGSSSVTGDYTEVKDGFTTINIYFNIVSGYLVCNNTADIDNEDELPLQITKITIAGA